MRKILIYFSILLHTNIALGQEEIWIKPNRGQWHENVVYKIGVPTGDMYLEKGGFTYFFNNKSEFYNHSHEDHHHDDEHGFELKGQVVRTNFINSNPQPIFKEIDPSDHYENYLIGNDSTKWVQNLHLYNEVDYINLYPGINLNVYQKNSTLKYDIIVAPNSDPNQFRVSYSGASKIKIKDEALLIKTEFGELTEKKPFAYQLVNGIKKEVKCEYVLNDTIMNFAFPDGYDTTQVLVIDPELAFSTFTGASADNWGMTACPDINDNLIAGGIVFESGYPLISAYDNSFNGSVDVGITKFNANGSAIVYSTYIGGSSSETPHSIIVNDQNELYIMGATSSLNFPLSPTAYQNSFGGGSFMVVDGITFSNGSDIFIFKLSAGGNNMLASTYLGGDDTDGISNGNDDIAYNYGDQLRGEIIVDDNSNVYVTSTTRSSDFPTVNGFDAIIGGSQDGIITKLNSDLSNLLYSTYIGGSGWESGNSIQLSSTGDIFAVGGTTSSNLPNATGQLNSSYKGGITDGYVVKLSAPAYDNPKTTYLGTNEYDQAYLVQLDIDDKVYVYGQTEGPYPVSTAQYSNPNSGQFIHKLNNDLTISEWSSVFGAGTGHVEISPTAFLVSDCYEIYIAGWGGETNTTNSSATNSSTNGFPVTSDAYQSTTSGSNFYLAVFSENMLTLKYATFMGSTNGSNDHVDGGTSRFDKSGKVYHAVCAACGGNDDGFPTTSGVYSETNNSNNCNLAAFLFELSKIDATLSTATPVTCLPNATSFANDSQNGNAYTWFFGDGGTSTDFEPTHQYTDPGDYNVMLIVGDVNGCYEPDTAYIPVTIVDPLYEVWSLEDTICPGATVQVFATGGTGYSWGPPELFDNPESASPFVTIDEETELTVDISSECGSSQVNITVYVYGVDAESGLDTGICVGSNAILYASGGESYSWTPAANLDDPNIATPSASPLLTTYYIVEIITPEGCFIYDTTKVRVDQDLPFPNLIDEVTICKGTETQISAYGAIDYLWTPDYNISSTTIYNPFVNPAVDTSYAVTFTNACGSTYDTVDVKVIEVIGEISNDTIICPEGRAILWASGGVDYDWNPRHNLTNPNDSVTIATPNYPTNYSVLITDEYGCTATLSTFIDLFESPTITVSPTVYGFVNDTTEISAQGDGVISWGPAEYISCTTCTNPLVYPPSNYIYTATVTDENSCIAQDDVEINYDPLIYVPNAFTPDGDRFNNTFFAVVHNVSEFEMYIFNRWGELIFVSNSIDTHWTGTYNGLKSPDGVYVWKIKYRDLNGIDYEEYGHVTLLR